MTKSFSFNSLLTYFIAFSATLSLSFFMQTNLQAQTIRENIREKIKEARELRAQKSQEETPRDEERRETLRHLQVEGEMNGLLERASSIEVNPGTDVFKNVSYGAHALQTLDVYVDKHKASHWSDGAPVIIMVHGGGWKRGDKTHSASAQNKMKYFTNKGYVFVSVNYRLLPSTNPLEQAGDVAQSIKFVQQNAKMWGGSEEQIVLMGHSAGAHLISYVSVGAASFGLKPWRASVALDSGGYDISKIMNEKHFALYDEAFGVDTNFWVKASPYWNIKEARIPLMLVCSANRSLACEQANSFAIKLKMMGGKAFVYSINYFHKSINEELGRDETYTHYVDNFISRELGK